MKSNLLFVKLCFALFFVAFFYTATFAQKVKFGLQGGVNYSGLHQSYPGSNLQGSPNLQGTFGGQFNLFVEKNIGSLPFSVSVEPGVIFKGYSDLISGTSSQESRHNFRLNYANVPIAFNYFPTQRLGLSVGTELNYLIAYYIKGVNSQFLLDLVNRFEVAGLVGAQYRIGKRWILGSRYTQGITTLLTFDVTNEQGVNAGKLAQRNMSGQIFVRYLMN